MKPLFACIAMAFLPISAHASTDLARQWGQEAARLSAQTSDMITAINLGQPLELSDTYSLDLYRFGRTSADLARWIDGANGPDGLECLFRGIAAESEAQLAALETMEPDHVRTKRLYQLASLFSDAEIMAVAAQRPSLASGISVAQTPPNCMAPPRQ